MTYSKSILMETAHEVESQHACSQSTGMSKWETLPIVVTYINSMRRQNHILKRPQQWHAGRMGRDNGTNEGYQPTMKWSFRRGELLFTPPLSKQDRQVPVRLRPSQALPRLAGLLTMSPSRLCMGCARLQSVPLCASTSFKDQNNRQKKRERKREEERGEMMKPIPCGKPGKALTRKVRGCHFSIQRGASAVFQRKS